MTEFSVNQKPRGWIRRRFIIREYCK